MRVSTLPSFLYTVRLLPHLSIYVSHLCLEAMEFLQCAMAAWIALCNSSIVLLSEEENVMDVAERRPLLVGDVRVEAGAENCPFLRRHPSCSLRLEWPEKE